MFVLPLNTASASNKLWPNTLRYHEQKSILFCFYYLRAVGL
jgi:hypothetical protein